MPEQHAKHESTETQETPLPERPEVIPMLGNNALERTREDFENLDRGCNYKKPRRLLPIGLFYTIPSATTVLVSLAGQQANFPSEARLSSSIMSGLYMLGCLHILERVPDFTKPTDD